MTPTDAMVDAADEAFDNTYEANLELGSAHWTDNRKVALTSALTAALAVSGYGEVVEALINVRKLISEAAATGFNYKDGDWPERLYFSQQKTSTALSRLTPAIANTIVSQGN